MDWKQINRCERRLKIKRSRNKETQQRGSKEQERIGRLFFYCDGRRRRRDGEEKRRGREEKNEGAGW